LREGDTVARLGGDEFVLVLVDIGRTEKESAAAAEAVGKKLLALLNQPYHLGNVTHVERCEHRHHAVQGRWRFRR
jgi:GGDEF domain-containing protein